MKLILASNSPRRKELLGGLNIPYEVHIIKGIDESYPEDLPAKEVAEYISRKKAAPYKLWFESNTTPNDGSNTTPNDGSNTTPNDGIAKTTIPDGITIDDETIIITADTVVVVDNEILGKPKNETDAFRMLSQISGRKHQVYTGVCLLGKEKEKHFSVCTDVTFRHLTDEEKNYYIKTFRPLDKAGAYGIQEWIGYIGVTKLEGSYFNVMGLPVQRIYDELKEFLNTKESL